MPKHILLTRFYIMEQLRQQIENREIEISEYSKSSTRASSFI